MFKNRQSPSPVLEARAVAALGGDGNRTEDTRGVDYMSVFDFVRLAELYTYYLCVFLYACVTLTKNLEHSRRLPDACLAPGT